MKPVAWIKVRELDYMKAVARYGKDDWQTNLGLKPEPDDEGLYTETQVQQLLESFDQSVTDQENQPSQYGTVTLEYMEGCIAAERQRIVNLLMIQHEAAKGTHNYWQVAANLIQADVASDA